MWKEADWSSARDNDRERSKLSLWDRLRILVVKHTYSDPLLLTGTVWKGLTVLLVTPGMHGLVCGQNSRTITQNSSSLRTHCLGKNTAETNKHIQSCWASAHSFPGLDTLYSTQPGSSWSSCQLFLGHISLSFRKVSFIPPAIQPANIY